MKKKSVWVAEDGSSFDTQEECLRYERNLKFTIEVIPFFAKHLNLPEDRTISVLHEIKPFVEAIRDNAEEFQKVLDAAKPKARRGRPPKKKEARNKVAEAAPALQGFVEAVSNVEDVSKELQDWVEQRRQEELEYGELESEEIEVVENIKTEWRAPVTVQTD